MPCGAGGPSLGCGAEGTGKRDPFFPVPAILATENHPRGEDGELRGARGPCVGGHPGWAHRVARASSPACSGDARTIPHVHLQGLRARGNPPNRPEALKIGEMRAASFYLIKSLIHLIIIHVYGLQILNASLCLSCARCWGQR